MDHELKYKKVYEKYPFIQGHLISNLSFADIGELILLANKSMYWKDLASTILDIKYPWVPVQDRTASSLAEVYNAFCLDYRFQYQHGHIWTLRAFLPSETKRKRKAPAESDLSDEKNTKKSKKAKKE